MGKYAATTHFSCPIPQSDVTMMCNQARASIPHTADGMTKKDPRSWRFPLLDGRQDSSKNGFFHIELNPERGRGDAAAEDFGIDSDTEQFSACNSGLPLGWTRNMYLTVITKISKALKYDATVHLQHPQTGI